MTFLRGKTRRDRINRSIENLRELFHKTTPMSERQFVRLDKADILEMTVDFFFKRRAKSSYARGFSQCLQETLRHVSLHAHYKGPIRCTSVHQNDHRVFVI
uniref:BHLH domain-containing protein n=1 Tax=Sinocyclocheilus grahami TaxID=75366 RepID=A0A672NYM4_SINGR